MSIKDWLFGKKITVQFRDRSGNVKRRKISESNFNRLEQIGIIKTTKTIEVHVLDPKGDYTTTWTIGKDVSADVIKQARDSQTGALYAFTTYEAGNPQIHVCLKYQWLKIKAQFDAIEQETRNSDEKSPLYINENLVDKEYILIGETRSAKINAALFTAILLQLRNTGWNGADELFDSSFNDIGTKIENLGGSYVFSQHDARLFTDALVALTDSPTGSKEFDDIIAPLVAVASQGTFTLQT